MDMNAIDSHLSVGAQDAADDKQGLLDRGITHVISIREPWLGFDYPPSIIAETLRNTRAFKLVMRYMGWVKRKKLVAHRGLLYYRIWATDQAETDLYRWFGRAARFVDRAAAQNPNAKVLIHCAAGMSRSATVAIAVQLWFAAKYASRVPLPAIDSLLRHARAKRPVIQPNAGFLAQLEQWRLQLLTRTGQR
jgi:hypothetical protein